MFKKVIEWIKSVFTKARATRVRRGARRRVGRRSYRRRKDGTELSFVVRQRGGSPNVKRV